jgi:hypothetical protein
VRRILPAALLGAIALALAGTAAAAPPAPPAPVPYVNHTIVGGHFPLRAFATITPPVALFGDAVKATLVVLADRKWVEPSRINPDVSFALYKPVGPPTLRQSQSGRLIEMRWTWMLRCLTAKCVPILPPSNTKHIFHFPTAKIQYLDPNGNVAWTATTRFPAIEALSDLSPSIIAYAVANQRVKWQYQLTPAAVSYRISPSLVFGLAVLLAAICAAAALFIAGRWVQRLRSPAVVAAPEAEVPSLERALALFFWAREHGDETLQRKALERVAAELPIDVSDLSSATRELAWSAETPEEDEVEAISERAGVPAHHENGAGG